MSGSDPQSNTKRSDESPQLPSSPPRLVFKPDVRQAALVARVRLYTLIAAAILALVALFLILSYRPPVVIQRGQSAPVAAAPLAESVAPTAAPVTGQPPVVPHRAGGVDIARSAAATVDTLVTAAAEKWLRAAELSPQGVVTRDNAEDAADKLRKAVILADSARQDIARARQQAEVVRRASREAESRAAFRLGLLYAAIDRYLKSVDEDARDRHEYYVKSQASVKAILLDDPAESETQQNVAVSYLRRSEERQPSIRRLAEQVRDAQRNIENGDR